MDPETNQVTIYETPDGKIRIEVRFEDENLWLSQKLMAELFGVNVRTINEHLQNIFRSNELQEDSVIRKFRITAADGKSYNTKFYSLEAIIAVGYRVNSDRGSQFRIWATDRLKEYILKGYAIDTDRFKYGTRFDTRYFEALLEEIREIRASERMVYQKITDIYATAADYSPHTTEAERFFSTVQNKMHYAITGQTAAEIIAGRADKEKPNMGLTSWRKAPSGKVLKSDIKIAKNYLSKEELKEMNHIVNMYLDYAELQASRGRLMKMRDWEEKLNAFLQFNDYEVLQNKGRISREIAQALAEQEYKEFRITQDKNYISDFDKIIKDLKKPGK
ncbi:MAG: virulence RhuM family protein [Spirochaetota bacterium]